MPETYGKFDSMDPYDLTQAFATRRPSPPPMLPTSPSRGPLLQQATNPIIPTTGAARYWYVDPTANRAPTNPLPPTPQSPEYYAQRTDAKTGLLPKDTPFGFSKGGRTRDTIPAMLSKGEVVLTKAQQKKVGLKRIRDVIGNKHGVPIDGGAYGFQGGGQADTRTQPYLADDRSDLMKDVEDAFYGGGNAPKPTPTPPVTPTPPPTQKMVDSWSKMYGWGYA